MDTLKPILTIAIPTYNRSVYLKDTINSIVSQPGFNDTYEVEIVVSDNCSTDGTQQMMQYYLEQYPSKVKYHRNDTNIKDLNYEKVLSLSSGTIIKLNNDTLKLNPNSLGELLKIINHCIDNNLVPFLLQGKTGFEKQVICQGVGSFVSTVSYLSTWIGGFFIYKTSFDNLKNFSQRSDLLLTQVDVLMRLLKKGDKYLIIPNTMFTSVIPEKKGGYNLPKIFLTNYFRILGEYLTTHEELRIFNAEKRNILFKFILPWLLNVRVDSIKKDKLYTFDVSDYEAIIKQEFSYFTYIYFETCLYIGLSTKLILPKSMVSKIKSLIK
jgi:abequosyltransferase